MTLKTRTTSQNKTIVADKGPTAAPSEPDLDPSGCLIVIYGDDLGRRVPISPDPVIIGRSAKCEVQIDQESISRNHCRIRFDGRRFVVRDLGSTNGTYVNDELIDEVPLGDGDQLKVGRTILKFILGTNVEAEYHEEIYRLMTTDGLTQVANKRLFDETFEQEVARAKRYQRTFSLLVLDIDHFKKINDSHGHLAGDAILRQLGAVIRGRTRRSDTVARIGGEEFALITPEIGQNGAMELGRKINRLVSETRFEFEGNDIEVTISIGVAEWQQHYESGQDLLKAADEKLYEAKRLGRNRVCG